MPAGEGKHVAADGPQAGDHAVGPRAHVRHVLAARAAVAEQIPVRPLLADLRGRFPLVVAVVPPDEVRVRRGRGAQPGPPTRAPGTLQGAGENGGERPAFEALAESAGVLLAAFGQRDVGQTGVLARDGPGRLAVARQVDHGQRWTHRNSSRAGPRLLMFLL